jgi:Protein of unknown function (DUF2510)
VTGPPAPGGPSASGADWYPDPTGRYEHRFFNGRAWTADVSRGGVRTIDPLGVTPAPSTPVRDGRATAALVLGVLAVTLAWVPLLFVAGVACAAVAIVLGVRAGRRRPLPDDRGFARAGVVLGIVAVPLAGVGVWLSVLLFAVVDRYQHPPAYAVELEVCSLDRRDDGAELRVAGTLTNVDKRSGAYRVVVEVSRGGTTDRVAFPIDTVDPGESAAFDRTLAPLPALTARDVPSCRVADVTGPLPFGIEPP